MPNDTRGSSFRRSTGVQTAESPLLLSFLLVSALFQHQLACDALRMINLDAPDAALQGDTIHLSCFFSLQNSPSSASKNHSRQIVPASLAMPPLAVGHEPMLGDDREQQQHLAYGGETSAVGEPEVLYAIKWYKDEREFFRYLSQDWPRKQALPTDGIQVDVDKSDNHTVVLRDVSLKTSGLFRCEVSTDAPYFVTKSMERRMLIYSLPDQGPIIAPVGSPQVPTAGALQASNGPKSINYYLGEHVELFCSGSESKPAAMLDWVINDSLNLSAAALLANQVPLFEVRSQRFVRLPTVAGSISATALSRGAPLNQMVMDSHNTRPTGSTGGGPISPIAYAIYELHNGNMAVPYQTKDSTMSARPPVSLAASLHQLPEVSASRLNFTVDANLLQLLSLSKFDTLNSRVSRREVSSVREINVKAATVRLTTSNPVEELALVKSWSEESLTNKIVNRRVARQANKKPSIPHKRSTEVSRPNSRHHQSSFLSSSIYGTKKKTGHRNGVNNDNHKLVLKIKCVARVLHLSMSDEIKIKLANRTRELAVVANDSATTSAQRRQRPVIDKNSGCSISLRLEWQPFLIALVCITIVFIY